MSSTEYIVPLPTSRDPAAITTPRVRTVTPPRVVAGRSENRCTSRERGKPIYFLHDTPQAVACDGRDPTSSLVRRLANYKNITRRIGLFPTHCRRRASQEISRPGICTALAIAFYVVRLWTLLTFEYIYLPAFQLFNLQTRYMIGTEYRAPNHPHPS